MTNIWSEEETLRFYDGVLAGCGPNETDFLCIAARKKYMTGEQKASIRTGNTCMMGKTILKEHDRAKFLSVLHRLDAQMDWFTDLDGRYIPRSCMVFYMNVNHTDVLKAVKEFKKLIVDWDYDLAAAVTQNNIGTQMKTIQNNLLKSFQDPKNQTKGWTDIDCDIPDVPLTMVCEFKRRLKKLFWQTDQDTVSRVPSFVPSGLEPLEVVITHGGFHVLVRQSSISEHNRLAAAAVEQKILIPTVIMSPERLVGEIGSLLFTNGFEGAKEIKVNRNAAVPLPGTIQGGFEVHMI